MSHIHTSTLSQLLTILLDSHKHTLIVPTCSSCNSTKITLIMDQPLVWDMDMQCWGPPGDEISQPEPYYEWMADCEPCRAQRAIKWTCQDIAEVPKADLARIVLAINSKIEAMRSEAGEISAFLSKPLVKE